MLPLLLVSSIVNLSCTPALMRLLGACTGSGIDFSNYNSREGAAGATADKLQLTAGHPLPVDEMGLCICNAGCALPLSGSCRLQLTCLSAAGPAGKRRGRALSGSADGGAAECLAQLL